MPFHKNVSSFSVQHSPVGVWKSVNFSISLYCGDKFLPVHVQRVNKSYITADCSQVIFVTFEKELSSQLIINGYAKGPISIS